MTKKKKFFERNGLDNDVDTDLNIHFPLLQKKKKLPFRLWFGLVSVFDDLIGANLSYK